MHLILDIVHEVHYFAMSKENCGVPTLVQLGNLKIQLYADDHNPPHFHVVTPDTQAQVRIDDLCILRGSLRRADYERAVAWARQHMKEISDEWDRLN